MDFRLAKYNTNYIQGDVKNILASEKKFAIQPIRKHNHHSNSAKFLNREKSLLLSNFVIEWSIFLFSLFIQIQQLRFSTNLGFVCSLNIYHTSDSYSNVDVISLRYNILHEKERVFDKMSLVVL